MQSTGQAFEAQLRSSVNGPRQASFTPELAVSVDATGPSASPVATCDWAGRPRPPIRVDAVVGTIASIADGFIVSRSIACLTSVLLVDRPGPVTIAQALPTGDRTLMPVTPVRPLAIDGTMLLKHTLSAFRALAITRKATILCWSLNGSMPGISALPTRR